MKKKEISPSRKLVEEPSMEKLVIGGATYTTRLTKKFKNRKVWERPDVRNVNAVIPGAIQKIMVKEGDEVLQGTPMLVLVAMKMENLVLSPMDGVVKKIHVSEGDMVAKSNILLEFV